MHPLFSDAPVMQQAQSMPQPSGTSQLAAALAGSGHPLNLQAPSMGNIPLASMMQAMNNPGTGSNVTSQTPNLAWNPNNPVGTDTLGGNTANQGNFLSNALATYAGGNQAPPQPPMQPPGMPTPGMPGVPPMMAANGMMQGPV